MRRFRFIGDPVKYSSFYIYHGMVLDGNYIENGWDGDVSYFADIFPNDWKEVFEEKKLHQTDLGYYAGLFASQGCNIDQAIIRSKELIKKVKQECQNQ